MAFPAPPAVCSLPAYQTFIPLSGFPPALGYCSTTSFLDKRTDHITASLHTPRDVQCPADDSHLCDLLSELKASDPEFTRGACCCIGVCLGTQPTALVTVSVTTPSTASSISTLGIQSSSISDANSNTVTSPNSNKSRGSTSSSSTTSGVSSTSGTSSSSTSNSFVSSAPSTSSSTSSSSAPSTSSSTFFSSVPSTSSSTISSSTSIVTADPSCTAVADMAYTRYYSGQYFIENTDNPGNDDASHPPIYLTLSGTLSMCPAATDCGRSGLSQGYLSFDLHYLTSNATWECVLYYNPNRDASYFNVADSDAYLSFGYS